LEQLEDRTLLTLPAGAVPAMVDPFLAGQELFAPDLSERVIAADPVGPAGYLFKFAVDGPEFTVPATFDLSGPAGDAALALYDSDGNQLLVADADPMPGIESLTAELESRRAYVLGVFFEPAGPPVEYTLTVATGPQIVNTTLAVDPTTGLATLQANAGEDTFNSTGDVDYFPIDLTNAGAGGTVTVTPTGLDVHVAATLFRRDAAGEPWQPIASAVDNTSMSMANPVNLAITPAAGQSLTDSDYLLAVAPRGFDTAPRSSQIDLTTALPLLGPGTIDPMTIMSADSLPMPPVQLGVSEGIKPAEFLDPTLSAAVFYKFRAPADGVATIAVDQMIPSFDPLVSVFGVADLANPACPAGLLDVASRTSPEPLVMTCRSSLIASMWCAWPTWPETRADSLT
jgi:hypothetical protein